MAEVKEKVAVIVEETQIQKDAKERAEMQKRIEKNKKDRVYVKIVALKKHEKNKVIDVSGEFGTIQIQDGATGWIPRMAVENLKDAVHVKHKFVGDPPKHVKYEEPAYMVIEVQPPEEKTAGDKLAEDLLV